MLIKLYLDTNIHYSDSIKVQLRASQDQALHCYIRRGSSSNVRLIAPYSTSRLRLCHSAGIPLSGSPCPKLLNIQWCLPGASKWGQNWEGQVKETGTHSGTESQGLKFRVHSVGKPQQLMAVLFPLSLLCPASVSSLALTYHLYNFLVSQ